jgi:hypothetical protein
MKYAIVALLVLSGCSGKLRPDLAFAPIDSGYPSAELYVEGNLQNGLAICALEEGEPLSKCGIAVQGYYSGVVRMDSEACGLSRSVQYQNSQLIKIDLTGPAKKNCMIAVTVSPEYPGEQDQAIVIKSLRGYVAIRVGSKGDWEGFTAKKTANFSHVLKIRAIDKTARVVISGCGTTLDKIYQSDLIGVIEVDLRDAYIGAPPKTLHDVWRGDNSEL